MPLKEERKLKTIIMLRIIHSLPQNIRVVSDVSSGITLKIVPEIRFANYLSEFIDKFTINSRSDRPSLRSVFKPTLYLDRNDGEMTES